MAQTSGDSGPGVPRILFSRIYSSLTDSARLQFASRPASPAGDTAFPPQGRNLCQVRALTPLPETFRKAATGAMRWLMRCSATRRGSARPIRRRRTSGELRDKAASSWMCGRIKTAAPSRCSTTITRSGGASPSRRRIRSRTGSRPIESRFSVHNGRARQGTTGHGRPQGENVTINVKFSAPQAANSVSQFEAGQPYGRANPPLSTFRIPGKWVLRWITNFGDWLSGPGNRQRRLLGGKHDTCLLAIQAPYRPGHLEHLAERTGGCLHEHHLERSQHQRLGFQDGLGGAWQRRN